ncbi:cilia- and flagella-associated protein 251 isoform X2 [Ooceraea biroi]|uniref:cilia- and flagella-associated protein 251 isoform X2 n=1 Tax=Ooceraea biroi TaxID=2015173 RepID=UPI0009715A2B|nr:cilia- and flagella-associated protein 251 isoform X2 [Ooceraea biroi]
MPPLPNFQSILERQTINENIIYVTCPHSHESLKAVTALKFSPRCDMLVCGLENGAIWILHHITLQALDEIPYKHSSTAINKIAFTRCAEYMAYADNALTVVVFKRNGTASSTEHNVWNLIGKYHSHHLPIRDILFGPAASDREAPRFFSLGEDQELIEYDLLHRLNRTSCCIIFRNHTIILIVVTVAFCIHDCVHFLKFNYSGPYPVPGLKILRVNRIEQSAIPLCLAWYPQSGTERFLVTANSEYKYKIFSEAAMAIRGTYLGPTFGEPIQQFQILTNKFVNNKDYMVFATDREIGLQLLPLDGNPYKIIGMTGHPEKITSISVSNNGQTLFTTGYNDPCVLMWKIRHRSVDTMARLGGEGLSPFHCLIESGKDGWLINEMKDLFYYAQILHQGENTTAARIVSDTVVVEQISNLMRAIGYYPTNEEIENIMAEVCYKHYVKTGRLVDEVTFEEFVQLYVNHRPAFKVRMRQMKGAFRAFVKESFDSIENPTLTREQFMNVLFGEAISGTLKEDHKLLGEPLTLQEAYTYLKLLVPSDEKPSDDYHPIPSQRSFDFRFLPTRISYKDFAMDIMGVELPGGN